MSDGLLSLLSENQVPEDGHADDALFLALVRLVERLSGVGFRGYRRALTEVTLRAVETAILSDAELLRISRYWETYLGRERALIAARLTVLCGETPSPEAVEFIRSCLETRAWFSAGRDAVLPAVEERLFERVAEASATRHLRCALCGYHFRMPDLGQGRLRLVDEYSITLADTIDPRRREDPWKPVELTRVGADGLKAVSLTTLTVDHIMPVAGMGSSDEDNLRFACTFCNFGKQAARRAFEPLSVTLAGALLGNPERGHGPLRQVTVASAIAGAAGCGICRRAVNSVELTVTLQAEGEARRNWFVPWNLDIRCYDCRE